VLGLTFDKAKGVDEMICDYCDKLDCHLSIDVLSLGHQVGHQGGVAKLGSQVQAATPLPVPAQVCRTKIFILFIYSSMPKSYI
jgi:hypothetical protein